MPGVITSAKESGYPPGCWSVVTSPPLLNLPVASASEVRPSDQVRLLRE